MDFQKEREGREILEQDFLWILERSRREALAARSGVCALGCLGLFGERPLAQTSASASAAVCRWGRWGAAGPPRARALQGPGSRPSHTGKAAGGRGFLRAPALGDCGVVADGAGRLRPQADCRARRPSRFGEGCGQGSGPWLPSAAAQPCGLSGLRRETSSLTGLCFPAQRRAGPAGATSPPRASAGLATALTSPHPPAAGGPQAPASVRSQPAPPSKPRSSARQGPP